MRLVIDAGDDDLPEEVERINEDIRTRMGEKLQEMSLGRDLNLLHGVETQQQDLRRHPLSVQSAQQATLALEHWRVQAHAYADSQAAKVGLLGRLFSGEAEKVRGGVIHDAKRFTTMRTENSGHVEIGVAVRLSVATSNVRASVELTLPNLAAEAQLRNVDTRVGITVAGYVGPLGDLLPAPGKLDVETCIEYMEAFRQIQALIFGEEGARYLYPTVLSYER